MKFPYFFIPYTNDKMTNMKTVTGIVLVMLSTILLASLATMLISNQNTAVEDRYCETYTDTTTYNESNSICYEAANTTNTAAIVPNEAFNLFSLFLGIVILAVIISFIVKWFVNK